MYDNRIKANKPTDNESTGLVAFILIFICYSIITTESAENRLLQHNSFEHRVRPSMHEPPMFEGYRFCCPIPMKAFAIGCPTRCKNKITDSFSVDICFNKSQAQNRKVLPYRLLFRGFIALMKTGTTVPKSAFSLMNFAFLIVFI